MRRFCAIFLLTFPCMVLSLAGIAQTPRHFNITTDDISTMIPPLHDLIDSAIVNNSGIKSVDLQIIINKYALQTNRNYWTRNLSVLAEVRYGNFTSYTSDLATNANLATTRGEFRYGFGGSLKFPIQDLLDRKNQIRIAQTQINLARSVAEEKQSELRKIVIMQYNELILKQRLMKLSAKNIETEKINMQMVEKEFLNGVLPLSEYARLSGIVSDTEAKVENARMDFLTAYMILEEVVGMKFKVVISAPGTDEHH